MNSPGSALARARDTLGNASTYAAKARAATEEARKEVAQAEKVEAAARSLPGLKDPGAKSDRIIPIFADQNSGEILSEFRKCLTILQTF